MWKAAQKVRQVEEKTKDALSRGDSMCKERPCVQQSPGELVRCRPQPEHRVAVRWEARVKTSGRNIRIIFPENDSRLQRDF